jgi:hypothetical protein
MTFINRLSRATVLSFLLLPLFASCGDGQALVTYKDNGREHKITRKELKTFLTATMGAYDPAKITVAMQDEILQNLALIRVAALAAKKEGLDKSEQYSRNQIMLDRRALIAGFDLYLKRNASSHTYKMLDAQMLFLKNDPGKDRRSEAEELLKKLNDAKDDGEIEKIIFDTNENQRYRIQAGYLDPYCISCTPNPLTELTDPIKDRTDKKFVLVSNQQGIWLIRNLKVHDAKGKDLERIFLDYHRRAQTAMKKYYAQAGQPAKDEEKHPGMMTDEQAKSMAKEQAEAQIRRETRSLLSAEIENLKKQYPVSFEDGETPPAVWKQVPADDTLLFRIKDQAYHYSDLKKEAGIDRMAPEEQFMLAMQVLLPSELLKKSPLYDKVIKSDEIDFVKSLYIDDLLANLYIGREASKVTVSDDDIRQMFELRQYNEFRGKTLAQVKDQIEAGLLQEKRQSAFESIKKNLFDAYSVRIEREKLKEGKL